MQYSFSPCFLANRIQVLFRAELWKLIMIILITIFVFSTSAGSGALASLADDL